MTFLVVLRFYTCDSFLLFTQKIINSIDFMVYKFEKASVLVVDDMQPMLSLTASLLKIFGFGEIHSANSADRAFEIFCKESPDLVITDWHMEPHNGMELIQRIRKNPASPNHFVPIILMTGYSAEARVMMARDHGVTEFLVKPFTANDLYLRINQVIEKPRKFVEASEFFGPDRRRKKMEAFSGQDRRDRGEDQFEVEVEKTAEKDLEKILHTLRSEEQER